MFFSLVVFNQVAHNIDQSHQWVLFLKAYVSNKAEFVALVRLTAVNFIHIYHIKAFPSQYLLT